jgi:hypothetical protein
VDTAKHQLILSFDDVAERNPNYQGGYVISFDVSMPQDMFAAHLNISGYGNPAFPALRRAAGRPMSVGGLIYAGAWGSFGAWNGIEETGTTAGRFTVYVKATTSLSSMWTSTGFSLQSGWVPLIGVAGATGNFGLIGTNNSDVATSGRTAVVGTITGCAGLSDSQVDALYSAKKQY